MNPKLRALLTAVLVAGGGAGIFNVFTYRAPSVAFTDLQDAGIAADCNPRLVVCSERINPVLRARLADAGDVLPAARKYARVVRQGFRCPSTDGGVHELIVPGFERFAADHDDSTVPEPTRCLDRPCADFANFCGGGPKQVRLMTGAPDCVRAPVGNLTCRRTLPDGGSRFFGEMNVFPASEATGAGCQGIDCAVMSGDVAETDL
jgi:hypothetical protein